MSTYSGNKLFGFSAATESNTLRAHYIPVNSQKNLKFVISPTIWNHVVMTYNGTILKTYVNNVFVDSISSSSPGTIPSVGFSIGGYVDIFFKGNIDDVAIWNRILSKNEMTGLNKACVLNITNNPSDTTVKEGSDAEFIISASDISATYQWQIDFGSGFQNLNNSTQFKGVANDTLVVMNANILNNNQLFRCISSLGACRDTSEPAILKIKIASGTNRVIETKTIYLYPNPASSQVNLVVDSKFLGLNYTIKDVFGSIVIKSKLIQENTSINLNGLSNGFYFLVIDGIIHYRAKIIKNQ